MGPWTYYSPFAVGILLVLALSDTFRLDGAGASGWSSYAWLVLLALSAGVIAQLLMFGFQGAFAQVLPVPKHKSIRGPSAVRAGYLILVAAVAALVAFLLNAETLITASRAVAILAAATGVAAGLIYIWAIPTAVYDFGDERR